MNSIPMYAKTAVSAKTAVTPKENTVKTQTSTYNYQPEIDGRSNVLCTLSYTKESETANGRLRMRCAVKSIDNQPAPDGTFITAFVWPKQLDSEGRLVAYGTGEAKDSLVACEQGDLVSLRGVVSIHPKYGLQVSVHYATRVAVCKHVGLNAIDKQAKTATVKVAGKGKPVARATVAKKDAVVWF